MVDLSYISGLPIQLDEETDTIYYDEQVSYDSEHSVSLPEIIPVLLNKFLKYPEKVYTQHKKIKRNDFDYGTKDLSFDLVIVPYGLLGIEYIKTHIYFTDFQKDKVACFVEVVRGQLTVLIQKNKEGSRSIEYNTRVEKIDIIQLEEGDRLAIPTGVYYTFVNTGNTQVVFTIAHSTKPQIVDYNQLQKEKGLAFYIISKNARLEIVANPKYKIDCKPIQGHFRSLDDECKQGYSHKILKEDIPLFDSIKLSLDDAVAALC